MPFSFFTTEEIYSAIDFTQLENALAHTGRRLWFDKGTVMKAHPGEVLVITSGQMSISNGAEESLELGLVEKFMPVGFIEHYYPLKLYYRVERPTSVVQLTKEEFDSVFLGTPERAELYNKIITYLIASLIHIYYERNNDSGYATIRDMLYRYDFRVKAGTLDREGIASFILKRTRLSRSYIFQILAGLKAGGYITIKNGKLISINRDIPERF